MGDAEILLVLMGLLFLCFLLVLLSLPVVEVLIQEGIIVLAYLDFFGSLFGVIALYWRSRYGCSK